MCAYVDGEAAFPSQVEMLLSTIGPDDNVVVVTDVLGGSVSNEFVARLHIAPFTLVAGMNVGLLAELVALDNPSRDDVSRVVEQCRDSIAVVNDLVSSAQVDEDIF